jgi:hypothetical protein
VRFLAIAVTIKERLVVLILVIAPVLIVVEVTTLHFHVSIATITSEINLAVQFINFVSFMAIEHTTQTEPMRLNVLG